MLPIMVQDRYTLEDCYKPRKIGVYNGNTETLNSKSPSREEI